jgi:hypothetical protein
MNKTDVHLKITMEVVKPIDGTLEEALAEARDLKLADVVSPRGRGFRDLNDWTIEVTGVFKNDE